MSHVYRFFNKKNEIIYVGRTFNSMKERMTGHARSRGHLGAKVYKEIRKIEYLTFPSDVESEIVELFLINKWKPIYNTAKKQSEDLLIDLIIPCEWSHYPLPFEKSKLEKEIKKQCPSKEDSIYDKEHISCAPEDICSIKNSDELYLMSLLRSIKKKWTHLYTSLKELEKVSLVSLDVASSSSTSSIRKILERLINKKMIKVSFPDNRNISTVRVNDYFVLDFSNNVQPSINISMNIFRTLKSTAEFHMYSLIHIRRNEKYYLTQFQVDCIITKIFNGRKIEDVAQTLYEDGYIEKNLRNYYVNEGNDKAKCGFSAL